MNRGTKVRVASYARATPGEDCNDQSKDQRPPAAHLLWGVHRERHLCREAEHRGVLANRRSTEVGERKCQPPSAPPCLCAAIPHRGVKAAALRRGVRRNLIPNSANDT